MRKSTQFSIIYNVVNDCRGNLYFLYAGSEKC